MTFTEAAREVLRLAGRPLHYKEITELAIERNLLSHVGKSPEVTMGARLAATMKKEGDDNPLIRVRPGVFALREWDEETIGRGLEAGPAGPGEDEGAAGDHGPEPAEAVAAEPAPDEGEGGGDAAEPPPPPEEAGGPAPAFAAYEDEALPGPDEELRAEIAAGASDVFAEEDDDDQPILGREEEPRAEPDADAGGPEGRRRRRRRRRHGSRSGAEGPAAGSAPPDGLPSYTTSPAFPVEAPTAESPRRGPPVLELAPGEGPPVDVLAGADLGDAIAAVLRGFDRAVGAVSLRQIAETAQRNAKSGGDGQLGQSQIAAAVRADNARRSAAGRRPRFRLAGGRVGLTDWLLEPDLGRLEREAEAALGRYREAARRAFVRKLAELPGHAFVELCMMVLERMGLCAIRQMRFPGASGSEVHFSARLQLPADPLGTAVGAGEGLDLALVIRRDGRDIGRERVTELRGSLHHYGAANVGWILTTGQILSGAREEAVAPGVAPVTLLDGAALAVLCEIYGVAVIRAQHPIFIPDVDLFEGLRAS
ncbi:MAG: restriction endonuclease [Deltaproteobacteria bacterium]|nr:restriction endonuclease [Deltaproteobacteria bacterium]